MDKTNRLTLALLGILLAAPLAGQELAGDSTNASTQQLSRAAESSIGTTYEFYSESLGGVRSVQISLPRGYQRSTASYPVLLVLDGERHFALATAVARHLAWADRIPDMIVVGVAGRSRSTEFTPRSESTPAGKADATLRFLTDELTPALKKSWRVAPQRILAGHSLAGLFAMYAMLKAPGSFHAYLAISPSLYWNEEWPERTIKAWSETSGNLTASLVMTVAESGERRDIRDAFAKLRTTLQTNAPSGLTWHAREIQDADHFSSVIPAIHRGLESLFPRWRGYPLARQGDVTGLFRHYQDHSERLGFSVAIPEQMLNVACYAALRQERLEEALKAARRNAACYPGSSNAFDTLGEVLQHLGKDAESAKAYAQAAALAQQAESDHDR